ncbi:hypothetical protein PQQ87_08940 [Paraburkholderia nemoris]|uniref:hypothetical protein n=1 Tax=Paraburkholderia nemoris TaxID=2793076 RepID=UPI0038BC7273
MMRFVVPTLSAVLIAGCAMQAAPNYIGGNYFMAGDKNCTKYVMLSSTRIMCRNDDGDDMGYRDAMTVQDMQAYGYQQQVQAQQVQSLNAQLQQMNSQQAAQNAQTLNSVRQYTPPQVTPIQQQGSGDVRCISTGIYTNCRY